MRALLLSLLAVLPIATPCAQEKGAAPRLVQAIELADGTVLTIRYQAVPWRGANGRALATAEVKRGLKIGSEVVPEGEYAITVAQDEKGRGHLYLEPRGHGAKLTHLVLRKDKTHARRLEIVLTAGDQDGHGVLRVAFGDHSGQLAITAADSEALRTATARAEAKTRMATAEIEARSILDQVHLFMVQNPGPIPDWKALITPDERGHAYVAGNEPKKDPWGNAYVIAPDADFPNKPVVMSWGPDGTEATEDDISTKTLRRRKRR